MIHELKPKRIILHDVMLSKVRRTGCAMNRAGKKNSPGAAWSNLVPKSPCRLRINILTALQLGRLGRALEKGVWACEPGSFSGYFQNSGQGFEHRAFWVFFKMAVALLWSVSKCNHQCGNTQKALGRGDEVEEYPGPEQSWAQRSLN